MTKQATILTPEEYRQRSRSIPAIWRKVAGSLRGVFKEDPVEWQRRIRKESEERVLRLERTVRDPR